MWFMVTAHKKSKDQAILLCHKKFNTRLAWLRIISEHCIGMLKGQFPWLRSIWMQITKDRKSIKYNLNLIEATIVLYNMMLDTGVKVQDNWIDQDSFLDVDDADRASHQVGNALFELIPNGAPNNK